MNFMYVTVNALVVIRAFVVVTTNACKMHRLPCICLYSVITKKDQLMLIIFVVFLRLLYFVLFPIVLNCTDY